MDLPDFDCSSTLLPSRNTRQRNPSHLGSYCHSGPRGISSTDFASIGLNGGRRGRAIATLEGYDPPGLTAAGDRTAKPRRKRVAARFGVPIDVSCYCFRHSSVFQAAFYAIPNSIRMMMRLIGTPKS